MRNRSTQLRRLQTFFFATPPHEQTVRCSERRKLFWLPNEWSFEWMNFWVTGAGRALLNVVCQFENDQSERLKWDVTGGPEDGRE